MNFKDGLLYTTDGDETIWLGTGWVEQELELSAKETLTHTYNLTGSASMKCDISYFNMDLFNNIFGMPSDGKFTLEYSSPIMIQARWHKKPRIRKKWLKRYGMKSDTIKVKADAKALEYHPGRIWEEQPYPGGVCADWDSYDFEAEITEYILRPDQKRRGIKIEM